MFQHSPPNTRPAITTIARDMVDAEDADGGGAAAAVTGVEVEGVADTQTARHGRHQPRRTSLRRLRQARCHHHREWCQCHLTNLLSSTGTTSHT